MADQLGEHVEYPGAPEATPAVASVRDEVTECLAFLARRFDRPSSPVIIRAGLALDEQGRLPFHQAESALDQLGLRGEPWSGKLSGLKPRRLPAILKLEGDGAAVLLEVREGEALLYRPGAAEPVWTPAAGLAEAFDGQAVCVEPDPSQEREGERPWQRAARAHWFWSEVWKVRRAFLYVALAAGVINMLAIALPLFTMNVYDRIIPNKSVVSLWVLALGVLLALVLVLRLWWRATEGRRLPPVGSGRLATLSRWTHAALYLAVALAVLAGLANAWVRGDSWFDLFTVPAFDPGNKALKEGVEEVHELAAHVTLILAALHAAAALLHHYVWKDDVLRRMLPGR
jgi:ATP-binding cassette subfamily C protein LapB